MRVLSSDPLYDLEPDLRELAQMLNANGDRGPFCVSLGSAVDTPTNRATVLALGPVLGCYLDTRHRYSLASDGTWIGAGGEA